MNNNRLDFSPVTDTLAILGGYTIQYGIFTENGWEMYDVDVLNTDGSLTETQLNARDILYLTEKGSMTVPSRPVLLYIRQWVNAHYPHVIEEIFNGAINLHWKENEIDQRMKRFEIEINAAIPNIVAQAVANNSTLQNLLATTDEHEFMIDLRKIAKNITCKIRKKRLLKIKTTEKDDL